MKTHFLYRSFIFCIPMVTILVFLAGCQQQSVQQQYQEVFIDTEEKKSSMSDDPHAFLKMMPNDEIHSNLRIEDPGLQGQLMKSVAPTSIHWVTPKLWQEKKGSGMRLATFVSTDAASSIETTIVSLAGPAGGRAANVARWLGQLNLPVGSDEEIEKFIEKQESIKTPSGLSIIVIDFTLKQKDAGQESPSMIAAITEGQDGQIFIKMTGSKQSVIKNSSPFRELLNSLTFSAEQ